jgi:uncharacterized protein YqhQ
MEAEYRVASYLILGALGAFDLFLIVYCIYLISNGLRPVRRRFLSRGKVHDTLFCPSCGSSCISSSSRPSGRPTHPLCGSGSGSSD